ncbi:MAG: Hint domain-containing protein [Dinoroseobacter sp.]|nr:Hint domain-containing protein [Dinoroseobacter sp.]
MSEKRVLVKPGAKRPVNPSVFGLRAFSEETILDTHLGPVPAKDVTPQHLLQALDGSFVEIEWIQRLNLDATTLKQYPDLKPVLIEAGQFGPGAPRRNTLVSRSHTVLAGEKSDKVSCFGSALLWSKYPTLFDDRSFDFTYIVIACQRTVFVSAEGLWFAC